MSPAGLFGNSVGTLSVLWLAERETAALLVVVVSLVFFWMLRERYLLVWSAGWMAYGAFLATVRYSLACPNSAAIAAIAEASFVIAIVTLASAALLSARSWRVLAASGIFGFLLVIFASVRPFYFAGSSAASVALEISCRLVALAAVVELFRSRLGRIGFGPFLFAAGLLTLNLNWLPFTHSIPAEGYLLAEIPFGSSLFLLALNGMRNRSRHLSALNELATIIARSQGHVPMVQTALEKLKGAVRGKVAWLHLMDCDDLAPAAQIGLSPQLLAAIDEGGLFDNIANVATGPPAQMHASILNSSQAPPAIREQLRKHHVKHIVLVPIQGKKGVIGTLSLGFGVLRSHDKEELQFLETAAQKIGIASENMLLSEQVFRSQRQWSATFDSIPDPILAHDSDFRVLKANRALLGRLNKTHSDIVGSLCELVLPRRQHWTGCPYCDRGPGLTEAQDPCFGGQSVVSTSSYAEQDGNQEGTIHVVHDTTARRTAEEKYRVLFEQVQEGVFVATLEGKLLECNDAFVSMLGYGSREELMALELAGIVGAVKEEREAFRRELEAHNYVRNFEMSVRRKDGELLSVAQSCIAARDATGRIERYQGFVLDITEKKRSEDEVRRRNRELNALNALAVIAAQSFDLDEILNLSLRQVVSLFGAESGSIYLAPGSDWTYRQRAGWGPRSEARTRLLEVNFPEGLGDLVTRSRAEVVSQDFLPHLPPSTVDFFCADRMPYWVWVLLWGKDKPIGLIGIAGREERRHSSNDENLLVAVSRQLSTTIEKVQLYEETCRAYQDLRRTQEQLLQSEKMSAVGQLVSGVAHELNNPLTAILGYAQLLESNGLDPASADYVQKLTKQAQRTHRVVQNLLSFARQRESQKYDVDLRKVLEETLTLREYDFKMHNVIVEREIAPGTPLVIADPHQLEQVLLNIINNAVDAMIEENAKGILKIRIFREETFVCIEFNDNGPGIKDPARIFDPFYTTKSPGKGTGLGLSICYGIVKDHQGEIIASNREEGGASITVRLPASVKAAVPETPNAPRREAVLAGRVLLVDDEAALEFERDVLVGAGASVTTASGIDQARKQLANTSADVIIANGRMTGGVDAKEIYQRLTSNQAGMAKGLLLTFPSEVDAETRAFLQERNVPFLAKPFEVVDLISQVRLLLQKQDEARISARQALTISASAGS